MLFSNYAPETQNYNPGLNFEGTMFDKILLGLSGYKTTGERNAYGKVSDVAMPIVTGIGGAGLSLLSGGSLKEGYQAGSNFGAGALSFQKSLVNDQFDGTNQSGEPIEDIQKVQNNAAISSALISSILGIADPAVKAAKGMATGGGSMLGSLFAEGGLVVNEMTPSKLEDVFENYDSVKYLFEDPKKVNLPSTQNLEYSIPRGDFGLYDLSANVTQDSFSSPSSTGASEKGILSLIAQGENPRDKNLNAPYIYTRRNSDNGGHFGKYQFEKAFVDKYYGRSPEEFLADPAGQERAMQSRLKDLNREAGVLVNENKGMDFDKARLLVHFKGLGGARKIARNRDFNSTSTVDPTVNQYFDRAYGKLLNYNGGMIFPGGYNAISGYRSDPKERREVAKQIDGKWVTGDISHIDYTLYSDGDYSEDVYMIDKSRAKDMGLSSLLEDLSFGEMRYGEYILPQKESILMKSIINDNDISDEKRKSLIGSLVFDSVRYKLKEEEPLDVYKEDDDYYDSYAKGGPVKPKYGPVLFPNTGTSKHDVIKFQEQYNSEVATKYNLPKIKVDGLLGNETLRAIQNTDGFGTPSTIKTLQYLDTGTGETKTALSGIKYGKLSKLPEIEKIASSINLPTSGAASANAISGLTDRVNIETKGGVASSLVDPAVTAPKTSDMGKNIVNGLMDLGSIATGIALGNTDLPDFTESELYKKSKQIALDNVGNGFSAEVVSDFNNQLNNSVNANINAIAATGGTQGQVIAGLSNVLGGKSDAMIDFANQNQNQINANNAALSPFANYDQNRLDSQTSLERSLAMDNRAAGAAIVGGVMQNRADKEQFDSEFGQGSVYNELLLAQKKALDDNTKLQAANIKVLESLMKK